jgi:hypothetical protein
MKIMENISNSILFEAFLKALFNVASRRTTSKFADEAIGATIKTLESRYDFMKYVRVRKSEIPNEGYAIHVYSDIDSINPELIGKAIEALVRVVYNDLSTEAGLYFVSELKDQAGEEITRMISDFDVDLDQIQLEQHYAFRRRERKKAISEAASIGKLDRIKPDNLLGYTWGRVSYWRHELGSKYCTLYDKKGVVLDRLNLERIIQNYVERLSGYVNVDEKIIEKESRIYEKEYEFLKLLLERDIDAELAMHILKISRRELNDMIKKLTQMEMLQYINFNTVEITDTGVGYLSKKEKK